jgi:hypothetical protein
VALLADHPKAFLGVFPRLEVPIVKAVVDLGDYLGVGLPAKLATGSFPAEAGG